MLKRVTRQPGFSVLITVLVTMLGGVAVTVFLSRVEAQSSCVNYNQCSSFQQTSPNKRQAPITYWFDDSHTELYLSAQENGDFKSHLKAAADDWALKLGLSISEVSSGGNVRIFICGTPTCRSDNESRAPIRRMVAGKWSTQTSGPNGMRPGKIVWPLTSGVTSLVLLISIPAAVPALKPSRANSVWILQSSTIS